MVLAGCGSAAGDPAGTAERASIISESMMAAETSAPGEYAASETAATAETETVDVSETGDEVSGSVVQEPVFTSAPVPQEVQERMLGKSYPEDCTIPMADLRYLQITYVNFDGETALGEMVCNQAIAQDLLEIFESLYEAEYQIGSIHLVDDFDADDERSMEANNTSAFNFRYIAGTHKLSNHAQGLAVDINPLFNPYVNKKGEISPEGAQDYADRSAEFAHKITKEDLAYQLFCEHGFTWGGDWKSVKDYQHFEKSVSE